MHPLTVLYARLKEPGFTWVITGSLGMALQGMDLDVHDIDLQSSREGVYAIQALFPELVTRPVELRQSETIRSFFGAMQIGVITIELMGDMQKRTAGGSWTEPPDLDRLTRRVDYAGMRLPVLDLEYEHRSYLEMGRVEKAGRIRRFLDGL